MLLRGWTSKMRACESPRENHSWVIPALVGAESTLEWTVKVIGGQEYTCYLKIKKEKKGHNCLGSYFNSTGALMKKLEIFESLFLRTTLPCRYKNQSLDNVKANVSYRSVENWSSKRVNYCPPFRHWDKGQALTKSFQSLSKLKAYGLLHWSPQLRMSKTPTRHTITSSF